MQFNGFNSKMQFKDLRFKDLTPKSKEMNKINSERFADFLHKKKR